MIEKAEAKENEGKGIMCEVCQSLHDNLQRIDEVKKRGITISIGEIIKVPLEIAETGFIKIVATQPNPGNTLQPGVKLWTIQAKEYDELAPYKPSSWFIVTKEELISWKEGVI